MAQDGEEILHASDQWLECQPFFSHTCRASRIQVQCSPASRAESWPIGDDVSLSRSQVCDDAIQDDNASLTSVHAAKPAAVNPMVAALDHSPQSLGLDPVNVRREDIPQQSLQTLSFAFVAGSRKSDGSLPHQFLKG